jgi:uncharacterized membrane protein (DUF4010 family)
VLDLGDPLESLDPIALLARIGLAAALGFLVGLQRERARTGIAGIRTFPLIAVWGAIAAILATRHGGIVLAASALALAAATVVENVSRERPRGAGSGITTEISILVMFGAGALVVVAPPLAAIVVSGGVAFLLQQKGPLHRLVRKIADADFRAVMQFVLITLVILPVLPSEPLGPYDTLNPFEIWLIVVLVVGLELAGFAAVKALGARAGVILGGVLGGLVSSTATTVSYARRSRESSHAAFFAELVILLSSAVAFGRLIVAVALVAPRIVAAIAIPLSIVFAVMLAIAGVLWAFARDGTIELPETENPAALRPALLFGAIYAAVTFASAMAEAELGSRALYGVAVIAGLADLNAITLSTATLAGRGTIDAALAWRVMLVAAIANLVFKLGVVGVLSPRLLPRVGLAFAVTTAVALALIVFWPA